MPLSVAHASAHPRPHPRIAFTVIGGFLGSGKTTAVNAILESAGNRRMAVLVNDFGGLAIDAALVAQRGTTTLALTNGCVCCSLVGGLAQALLDVMALEPPPECILVEASGVSDPRRIAQIARADRGLVPDATIVLVAADQWAELREDRYVGDLVATQVATADFLVLNKVDLVSAAAIDSVRSQLAALAPRARILETLGARLPYAMLLGHAIDNAVATAITSGERAPRASHAVDDRHARQFSSRIFRASAPVPAALLRDALNRLPPSVLRAKGFVRFDDAPDAWQLVQVVGSRWSAVASTPRAPGENSELVVMGLAGALANADLSALASAFGAASSFVSARLVSRSARAARRR